MEYDRHGIFEIGIEFKVVGRLDRGTEAMATDLSVNFGVRSRHLTFLPIKNKAAVIFRLRFHSIALDNRVKRAVSRKVKCLGLTPIYEAEVLMPCQRHAPKIARISPK